MIHTPTYLSFDSTGHKKSMFGGLFTLFLFRALYNKPSAIALGGDTGFALQPALPAEDTLANLSFLLRSITLWSGDPTD